MRSNGSLWAGVVGVAMTAWLSACGGDEPADPAPSPANGASSSGASSTVSSSSGAGGGASSGGVEPAPCDDGSFWSLPADGVAPRCELCAEGHWAAAGRAQACEPYTDCQAGEYVVAAGTAGSDRRCAVCAEGTFSTEPNAAACQAIPRGVSAGASHSCALRIDGGVRCWGLGQDGRLGDGAAESSLRPVQVVEFAEGAQIVSGAHHSCALRQDGQALCWGQNGNGRLGLGSDVTHAARATAVAGAHAFVALAAGSAHSCGVTASGAAYCWGNGLNGRLGTGAATSQRAPAQVVSLQSARNIAAGGNHSCAVDAAGAVWCWGGNLYGQLGDGSDEDRARPSKVPELGAAQQVALGTGHSCALLRDGTVQCWGQHNQEQLGREVSGEAAWRPAAVPGLQGVRALAAQRDHTCALKGDGTVWCWGLNASGQLGRETANASARRQPAAVPGLERIAALAAGAEHSCAVRDDGQVLCWGKNADGQLGDGSTTQRAQPTPVQW